MGRNAEMIRQWKLLQRLANRRANTIPSLSADLGVHQRTIRRDLDALQAAGFPIFDETVDGTKFWRLDAKRLIDALARNALTIPELCALYSSRALVKGIAGTHLLTDLQTALGKIEAALPSGMKKFFDRLPFVVMAKTPLGKRRATTAQDVTSKLFEATMSRHVVTMRYDSQTSGQQKDYTVHPYRLVYAQNSLYLHAFVLAYNELRTFLVDRIRRLTVEEDTFEPIAELGSDPFSKSLGAFSGPTVRVRLLFAPSIAAYVKDCTWHASQELKERADGSVVMTLQVSDDYALRQWILGFGRAVRVLGPPSLVTWVIGELEETAQQYASQSFSAADSDAQPSLPFLFSKIASA